MPAQKRSVDTPTPQPPPPPSSPLPPPVENDNDSMQPEHKKNDDAKDKNKSDHDEDQNDSDGSSLSSDGEKEEFIIVKLAEIRKEVQCPICLGIIRKTRTVMECLHRFCRECIDKSMRLGNNECPACRTHCASRRSLRDDPNYDALIAALYPDIDKYEAEELAIHDEERARNKLIQDSIADTYRRQSEALGRKRKRTPGRNLRGRRNNRSAEHQGSDEDEDANGHDGGKDSSSADERCTEVKPKRCKRWGGTRLSQPSAGTGGNAGCDGDSESNRDILGASAGLVGSSEILAWGKGGMRSHNRHGSLAGANGKLSKNSRLSKLIECLQSSDENEELDINLMVISLNEEEIPGLQRPYLCCRHTLSVKHLCEHVAAQTSKEAENIEMYMIKDLDSKHNRTISEGQSSSKSTPVDPSKTDLHLLEENQTLEEIQAMCISTQPNLILAYRQKQ